MNDNKTQKIVGAGSLAGILLMIAILFSNGAFGDRASTISAAGLDSEAIVQMDESTEMEEGEWDEEMEAGDEMDDDEDEMDEDEMDEDEMDEDEDEMGEDEMEEDEDDDEDEGGLLGFDFGFGWFGEND